MRDETRDERRDERREANERDDRGMMDERVIISHGRPRRSSRRNGKTPAPSPVLRDRCTRGEPRVATSPASKSLMWSSTQITPTRSTFVLSHFVRHVGPTATPVLMRPYLDACMQCWITEARQLFACDHLDRH